MKFIFFLAFILLHVQSATAANSGAKKKAPQARTDVNLGTSFRMSGMSLYGKYQSSPTFTTTVENDKYLEDILGARKDFNDRRAHDLERQ